ncbi:MAG: VTT domain-containing protein [Erysipelotrichales bacterium]|nr:VTT domain-containing protein [Erysipelotrichales bacterium]MBR3694254.1 VTT domain-containing protein [Erysipelotrichales bacterium]
MKHKKIWMGIIWVVFILLCLVNRDKFTVENIINYTPNNTLLAILVMLLLFSIKSVSVVIYGGLLYVASGIMFPFPVALLVNSIGTILMISIPFMIGKRAGKSILDRLIQKNHKLVVLRNISNKNEVFVAFFVRIIGMLPGDLVSMYMGASGINYKKYLLGSLLGLLPSIILFSIMGMSVENVDSLPFRLSLITEIALVLLSVFLYNTIKKKHRN